MNNHEQDWFKRNFPTTERPKGVDHPIVQVLNGVCIAFGIGLQTYGKLFWRRCYYAVPATYVLYRLSGYIVQNAFHLKLLHYLEPDIFTYRVLRWFYRFNYDEHFWTIFALLSTVGIFILGYRAISIRKKYQRIFETVGLTNHLKESPALTIHEKLKKGREKLTFDSKGVGISHFRKVQEALASAFDCRVESIELGDSPKFVVITLSRANIPPYITYRQMEKEELLLPDSFYLGMSENGALQIAIYELPHALAAGTTGAGKSIFFKQAILGLLSSSPHIQIYLIDLKGGLEMVDFKEAPNVRVIKSMPEAVAVLRKIKAEMRSRFAFLEEKGLKEINPGRDKKDRIIVAVDEASVLYMHRSKNDKEATLATFAREITDDIAKLSRAAAIHLVLATQKVSKETIETYIQENVSGRMCFKMNTVQGSAIVLGTNEAMSLPDTKGRGIWSFGGKTVVVQVPFVSEGDVKSRCQQIKNEFQQGLRGIFNPMIEVASAPKLLPSEATNAATSECPPASTADDSVSKVAIYLYQNKIATVDQVHRDLFPQLTRRAVAKKLAGYEENGYVESASYPDLPRQKAFHISAKAFSQFVDPEGGQFRQELKSEVVLHDLALVDIRQRLEADPRVKSFQTENVVNSIRGLADCDEIDPFEGINPDGIFQFDLDGEPFAMALEYESSEKFDNRYKDLFDAYYSRPGISGVLFVCKDEKILRHVRNIELSQKRSVASKVYYSSYATWSRSGDITFTNIEGKSIRINSVPPVPPRYQVELEENLEEGAKC